MKTLLIFSTSTGCCRERPHLFDGRDQLLRLAGTRTRKILGRKFQQKNDRLQRIRQRMSEILQNVSEVSDVNVELLRRVRSDFRNRKNLFLKALAGGAGDAAEEEVGRSCRTGTGSGSVVGWWRHNSGAKRKDSFLQYLTFGYFKSLVTRKSPSIVSFKL